MATTEIIPVLADSAESRRYNRIKRWLGLADFVLGFGLLVVLLATGWTGWLRDLAERGAAQNYFFAVFSLRSDADVHQQSDRSSDRVLRLPPRAPL
jgi:hypothetical protein